MQLNPLTTNRLATRHDTIANRIDKLLAGTGYMPGLLYIDGAAWITTIRRGDEKPIEIEVDIGDEEMLLAKIGALV